MSVLDDIGFETYLPTNYSEQGATAQIGQSTNQAHTGSNSLRANPTGTAGWITRTSGISTKVMVFRSYLYVATLPGATCGIFQFATSAGNAVIGISGTNAWRATWAFSTNITGAAVTANQWYLVEAAIDTNTGNPTIDWRINSAAQTQCTRAQASQPMTTIDLGCVSNVTADWYIDDFKATDSLADYPLGGVSGGGGASPHAMGAMGFYGGL